MEASHPTADRGWRGMLTIDLSVPSLWAEGFPHETFKRLRAERPIFLHDLTPGVLEQVERRFWICTKHEHARRIHRDVDNFTAVGGPIIQDIAFSSYPSRIAMDPPDLTQRRNILAKAFTPRAVAKLEAAIQDRASRYIDELLESGSGDWVTGFAHRLPMNVIGDIVGIPEEDRPQVFAWVDEVLHGSGTDDAMMAAFEYAAQLTRHKREKPADDIWSELCTAFHTNKDGSEFSL